MFSFLLATFFLVTAHALEMSKADFCLSQQDYISQQEFKVEGTPPPRVLISTVKRLMDEFSIKSPLVFHFTDHEGPRKVWSLQLSTAKHIYFAKNALDLLLGLELEKIAQEVCRPEWTGTKTYTVVYSNTVLEQFLRHTSTREGLLEALTRKTGWAFRSKPGETHYENEQDFRTEELVTLVKQFTDVPAEVLKMMKIKKLTRYRLGAPLPIKTASAIYFVEDQNIMFGDGALLSTGGELYGEGTVLHEMGHAYWYASTEKMRQDFEALSWQNKKRKVSGSEGFISLYATNSPEEDFAEHFSAFVHQPELLKTKAMSKYDYIYKNIFSDTTYFSTAAKNAKVWVTSPIPDTKNPWLMDTFPKSYKALVTGQDSSTNIADIEVVVSGAQDDISGIAQTLFVFEHVENDNFKVFVHLVPEPDENGTTKLVGRVRTNPHELAPGFYKANTLSLEDRAGNNQYYRAEEIPKIELPGLLSLKAFDRPLLDMSKIILEPAPVIKGYHGVITTLPIPKKMNMDSIHMYWEFADLEAITPSVCRIKYNDRGIPCDMTKQEGDFLKIHTYWHKEYPNSLVKLASFVIRYKGTKNSTKLDHDYVVPVNTNNASYRLESGHSSLPLLDLDVNKMKLATETKENKEGGDQNIEVLVPLLNREAGKFYIYTYIRTPSGKRIIEITKETSKDYYTITKISGVDYLKFHIPLKKNPEEGEYILESLEIKTEYEMLQNPYLPLDLNKLAIRKIKLLERGIRKTFTISDDKIINLN